MQQVYDKIISHLAEITGYDQSDITPSDSLVNNLGLDSLMVMDFHRLVVNEYPEMKEVDLEATFQQ